MSDNNVETETVSRKSYCSNEIMDLVKAHFRSLINQPHGKITACGSIGIMEQDCSDFDADNPLIIETRMGEQK